MASKKPYIPAKVETLDASQGYSVVAHAELSRAAKVALSKQAQVTRYEITNKEKFTEVLCVVHINGAKDTSDAQWQSKMIVRSFHPSMWKEVVMAFPADDGHDVYVRWAIWKEAFVKKDETLDF
jgi:hypothetical protein